MTMSFRNVSLILFLFCLNLHESILTFGNEFVHIKVHIPTEIDAYEPPHSIVHVPVSPSSSKVIHHYHHRKRRPGKKNPLAKHVGLLESILLSEVKEPLSRDHYKYLHNAENIVKHVDSFIVKPEKPKPHVETYEISDESPKPKPIVETYKVIESTVPPHDHHHNDDEHDEAYNYDSKEHTETYKVIDDLFSDFNKNFKTPEVSYYEPKKQHFKTVKIVDSHEPDFETDYTHFGHHSSSHDLENDFLTHEDHKSNAEYHYGTKTHTDTVKIIENKAPHQHSQEYSINFGKRPHSETVEIIETNTPSKSSSYYNRHKYPQHNYDYHGYHYEASNAGIGSSIEETYSSSNDHKYHDNYRNIPDEHYAPEPENIYLPAKRTKSDYNHHRHNHHSNMRHKALYDDEPERSIDSYMPTRQIDSHFSPAMSLTLTNHQHSSDSKHKAAETYTGFDSYSAPHVQGVASRGYQYPAPYSLMNKISRPTSKLA